ncbi:substrate-binding domain-containing protein [Verminephrobacter aporrectodeae]|uniref:substrate-binding domain-containing protein n=1 Tax=Verminephrobacter aporrectodeae TaxID=1110389 RepID=UPI002243E993|nr:substrate-binding domain-containing protein [Verminephrobacter aporrectodeae]MCW8176083.1 sugar ABC transporter substrate-binding protein [Verminephrobacter aporrectodeae subsp. tuberculatae]MCW8203105.1 sugar ABC transporter substrate-binding protein [Verminephrobacter aporrectodeae subsp. tuberculatae]
MKRLFQTLGLGWALCAYSPALPARDLVFGVVYLDSQGFYAGVRNGVEKAAAASGLRIRLIDINVSGDLAKESSFVQILTANRVDAIILSAISADGSVKAIRHAASAGIPVVCYNTCINEASLGKYVTAFVLGDALRFGEMLGAEAAIQLTRLGVRSPRVGVLNCEFVEVCVQRRKGFEKALRARLPDSRVVANQEATVLDKALSVGQGMLLAQPEINVLFGESGGATLGAIKAVQKSGRSGKVHVFGSDMTTELAHELFDHRVLKATVDVSGTELGRMAFALALAATHGKQPAQRVQQARIGLYAAPESAKAWLAGHPDGLP